MWLIPDRHIEEAIGSNARSDEQGIFILVANLLKADVHDRVLLPIFVIEVPPLLRIDSETFFFHGLEQYRAFRPLLTGSPGIVGVSAFRHFVVPAGHFHRLRPFLDHRE